MSAYGHPEYYSIAFSYQDAKRHVDFFEKVARRFCKIKVRRFLDIECGPSPQLLEIARRGYEAIGLDTNPNVLSYLRRKAASEGLKVETIRSDMRNFRLRKKCDFAFLMSGSLYVSSNKEFLKHLSCVARAIRLGGLYLLENVSLEIKSYVREEWVSRMDGIEVRTIFEAILTDPIEQITQERLTLHVNDHGARKKLVSTSRVKTFSHQEFKSLVELSGLFEFLGFFKHLSLRPLRKFEKNNVVCDSHLDQSSNSLSIGLANPHAASSRTPS